MLITGCSFNRVFDSNYYCKKLELNCIKKNQTVVLKTSKGNIDVQLYGENYPVTVNNFIQNVKKNIYKNKRFYKIINFPQAQLIHSGTYPENNHYKRKNKNLKFRRNIPLEIKLKKEIEPIYKYQIVNPSEISKLTNFFEKGSLGMVKNGENTSSSTEFFFVTNKFPELDGRYSIFGKVLRGIEILQKLDKEDLIYEIIISD
ncbi:peptidylprolyl isomerase [Prochlorococcus sp. AH-716-D22]|nr:peptidylprolyl isomerase [Prochlorococcus sp. AH-716-D22]